MGLHVMVVSKVVPVTNGGYPYYSLPGMEDRLEGLAADRLDGECVYDFSAGSYGGYGDWRALLCRVMNGVEPWTVWNNSDKWKHTPFYGLINFADNEGCIGPVWSKRLAEEFENGRLRFAQHPDVDQYSLDLYDKWSKAFELAADGGFVRFC